MNTLTAALVGLHARALTALPAADVPTPQYDPGAPGMSIMQTLINIAFTLAIAALVLAAIAAAGLVGFGGHLRNPEVKTRGWIAVASTAVGAIIVGSASGIVIFGTGLHLFS